MGELYEPEKTVWASFTSPIKKSANEAKEKIRVMLEQISKSIINTASEAFKNVSNIIINAAQFVLKNIRNILIWAFLTAISIGAVAYIVNIPIDYEINLMAEHKDYIVNKRSLKIHIADCHSVSRMSERNKLQINNSIENLLNDGYYICNRCKAGIKRKNEFIASSLEIFENLLFGSEDISLKTYEEYLNAIDEMGKWYVEHVATYETTEDEIATETAKEYYKRNRITKRGDICLYPCNNLEKCAGEYTKAGDDCVRFVFSCLNNMDKNFINTLSKNSKYKWSGISSSMLNKGKDQLQYEILNSGFEIYDTKPEKIDLNNDNHFDFEILPIDKKFKLRKGDILSQDGHVHIYLSDEENFGWGKVNNVYPQKTSTYIDPITNNIVCSGEKFNRVYRYIGEN